MIEKGFTNIKNVTIFFIIKFNALFRNSPPYLKEPYMRFLENKLRGHFDFTGVSINVYMHKK